MKRILVFASAALIAVACSKDSTQIVGQKDRIKVYSSTELTSQIEQKNTPFNFTGGTVGKASDWTYTLKAVAEPPIVESTGTTYATSIHKEGDLVFVTWHTKNAPHGGSVSVYDVSNPEAVVYKGRVDFTDTDFHDGAFYKEGGTNYFYVVGQRDRNTGAYYNDSLWHYGAVFGRITLGADSLLTSTYAEIALAGHAANGVALGADNSNMQVVTGDSASHIYKINGSTMSKLDSTTSALWDGEYIVSDGSDFYAFFGKNKFNPGAASLKSYSYSDNIFGGSPSWTSTNLSSYETEDVERNAMTVSGGVAYLAMGDYGVVTVSGSTVTKHLDSYGGNARDIAVVNDTVYVANGETNMLVADKSTNPWTVLGVRQGDGDYKSVHYQDGYLFVADAVNGFLIIKENK